jgi:hypothetical protein
MLDHREGFPGDAGGATDQRKKKRSAIINRVVAAIKRRHRNNATGSLRCNCAVSSNADTGELAKSSVDAIDRFIASGSFTHKFSGGFGGARQGTIIEPPPRRCIDLFEPSVAWPGRASASNAPQKSASRAG